MDNMAVINHAPVVFSNLVERYADITKCARCGKDHKNVRFIRSRMSYRLYWGVCPTVRKLISIVE